MNEIFTISFVSQSVTTSYIVMVSVRVRVIVALFGGCRWLWVVDS